MSQANVFYHPAMDLGLPDFGIDVPLADARPQGVAAWLKTHAPSLLAQDFLGKLAPVAREDLLRVHEPKYVDRLLSDDLRSIVEVTYERELSQVTRRPLSELRDRIFLQASVVRHAALRAMECGVTYVLGGGMHHAMSFGGRGYCLVHDVMIAVRALQTSGKARRFWVVDLDAHRGDGTAELAQHDSDIGTLSIHMKTGWPLDVSREQRPESWIPSTVDLEIAEGEEGHYLRRLEAGCNRLQAVTSRPDLVFVLDGMDASFRDALPSSAGLKLTDDQMLRRTDQVASWLAAQGLPSVWLMSGGYGTGIIELMARSVWRVARGAPSC